ncbi:MAG TPA: hypothetical protein VJJ22_05400 [Candidatus Paceibacterota bacterium]
MKNSLSDAKGKLTSRDVAIAIDVGVLDNLFSRRIDGWNKVVGLKYVCQYPAGVEGSKVAHIMVYPAGWPADQALRLIYAYAGKTRGRTWRDQWHFSKIIWCIGATSLSFAWTGTDLAPAHSRTHVESAICEMIETGGHVCIEGDEIIFHLLTRAEYRLRLV